jgi:hypothetical protein
MSAPSLADINNVFATRKNQFQKNIYSRFWRTNPLATLFTRRMFDMPSGRIPEVISSTHELPTSYPFNLPKLTLSSGTGDPACDVPAGLIRSGYKKRSFELEVDAWETPVICLTDLQFQEQVTQQVQNKEKGLREFAEVRISDWHRVHNIGMIDRKASTTDATSVSQKSDSLYDFSGLTLPTYELDWVHLDAFYDMFIRRGAGEHKVGDAGGMPVFGMVIGPGYKRGLFQRDSLVRETINYSSDPFLNFQARGITKAINGWAPTVDEFPVRFAADGVTPIYPTINQATSGSGYEAVENPAYRTVANGGQAVYEVVTLVTKDIYEVHVRPDDVTSFGKMGFGPQNYVGDIEWINNKDMDKNPKGNKGYYRIDLQMAAKPWAPDLGCSILTLAKD